MGSISNFDQYLANVYKALEKQQHRCTNVSLLAVYLGVKEQDYDTYLKWMYKRFNVQSNNPYDLELVLRGKILTNVDFNQSFYNTRDDGFEVTNRVRNTLFFNTSKEYKNYIDVTKPAEDEAERGSKEAGINTDF